MYLLGFLGDRGLPRRFFLGVKVFLGLVRGGMTREREREGKKEVGGDLRGDRKRSS